ncbi:DUF6950 family protein [Sphingobium sp. Cam5-1]|uniref:DUF6950 family protein n=1 Tax=Sphingobium sp. Cam5-1 TaxID=2789327 RepID=UPI0018AD2196|nr:hypothetical protein [Sphingobium sp. Cam5-1]QPI73938.1 hypothetical protein IZV00_05595 [Sphingobium sp. Cam5-1]
MNDMLRRQASLEKTLAKYRKRTLDFASADCVRMARFHLIQMGHKPPALPRYRSLAGAIRVLKQAGGMEAIFDALLPRIPHARMLPGDIALLEGDNGLDAAVICVGHKVIGWHEGSDQMVNMIPLEIKAAWRA